MHNGKLYIKCSLSLSYLYLSLLFLSYLYEDDTLTPTPLPWRVEETEQVPAAAAPIPSSLSSSSSSSSKKDKVVSYLTRYKQISGENALFYSGNLEYDNDNIYTREDIDVYEGPRGGKYYYNSYGNKIYI